MYRLREWQLPQAGHGKHTTTRYSLSAAIHACYCTTRISIWQSRQFHCICGLKQSLRIAGCRCGCTGTPFLVSCKRLREIGIERLSEGRCFSLFLDGFLYLDNVHRDCFFDTEKCIIGFSCYMISAAATRTISDGRNRLWQYETVGQTGHAKRNRTPMAWATL